MTTNADQDAAIAANAEAINSLAKSTGDAVQDLRKSIAKIEADLAMLTDGALLDVRELLGFDPAHVAYVLAKYHGNDRPEPEAEFLPVDRD